MKIGIISDTHQLGLKYSLSASIKAAFFGVGLIVHAGDVVYPSVIQELEKIAPVKIIRGNKKTDRKNFKGKLPREIILNVNNIKLAVIHCSTSRFKKEIFHFLSLLGLQNLSDRLLIYDLLFHFRNQGKIDCIIFGDTHKPFCKKINDVLLLNPGAAYSTYKRPGSVIVLDIKKKFPMVVRLIYFFS